MSDQTLLAARRKRPGATRGDPTVLFEVDFGDADFVVRKHADGKYTVHTVEFMVLSEDEFQQLRRAFTRVKVAK